MKFWSIVILVAALALIARAHHRVASAPSAPAPVAAAPAPAPIAAAPMPNPVAPDPVPAAESAPVAPTPEPAVIPLPQPRPAQHARHVVRRRAPAAKFQPCIFLECLVRAVRGQ